MRNRLLAIAVIAALVIWSQIPNANAAVVLDTYPATGNLWKPIAIAVPFTVPRSPDNKIVIQRIRAAVRGSTGTVQIGIMTDLNNRPSDTFLFSATETPSLDRDLFVLDPGWTIQDLAGAQLWLAVIESPSFSFGNGFWQGNASLNAPWAFKSTLDSPWFGASSQTPAALIKTPEPSPLFLVLSGFTMIGGVLLWYRRPRDDAGTHYFLSCSSR